MKLRPYNKYPGFYFDLNNGKLIQRSVQTYNKKRNFNVKPFKKELIALNYLKIKNLKNFSTKSPLIKCKMEPSKQFAIFLVQKYQIVGKYKSCDKLKKIFFLERYFNSKDYCTLLCDENGVPFFKIKILNERKVFFFQR